MREAIQTNPLPGTKRKPIPDLKQGRKNKGVPFYPNEKHACFPDKRF